MWQTRHTMLKSWCCGPKLTTVVVKAVTSMQSPPYLTVRFLLPFGSSILPHFISLFLSLSSVFSVFLTSLVWKAFFSIQPTRTLGVHSREMIRLPPSPPPNPLPVVKIYQYLSPALQPLRIILISIPAFLMKLSPVLLKEQGLGAVWLE